MRRRERIRWPLRAALLAAAIVGLGLAVHGLYMPAKAALGQLLLQRAYNAGAEPWPGADLKAVARLTVDRLGKDVMVLDNASGKAMAWGPGHVAGTPLPGDPGLSAIGGHRDSHLAFLGHVGPGDRIGVQRPGLEKTEYTVTRAEIVDSRTWRYPAINEGAPRLALTTCWPLDAETPGPLRLVVYADASPH